MISLSVVNLQGEKVEEFDVDERLLGGQVRPALLRQAVLMYEANARVGSAVAKTRGEVAGTTAKLFRQKGTGRARAGSRRAPQRVGGGKAHGPRPREFSRDMTKKARRLALRSAILSRVADGEAVVVDELDLPEPKTRIMARILSQLGIEGSCLIATADYAPAVWKAARNLPGVSVMPVGQLNAYEVLRPKRVLFTRQSLQKLLEAKSG
jgi:large subunit ribosomal protein L4